MISENNNFATFKALKLHLKLNWNLYAFVTGDSYLEAYHFVWAGILCNVKIDINFKWKPSVKPTLYYY